MAGTIAQVQVGIDRQAIRLSRIENRLGLVDAYVGLQNLTLYPYSCSEEAG